MMAENTRKNTPSNIVTRSGIRDTSKIKKYIVDPI